MLANAFSSKNTLKKSRSNRLCVCFFVEIIIIDIFAELKKVDANFYELAQTQKIKGVALKM